MEVTKQEINNIINIMFTGGSKQDVIDQLYKRFGGK